MVCTIGKTRPIVFKNIFKEEYITEHFLSKYCYDLWWNTWNGNYFGGGINSIFENDVNSSFIQLKNPSLFYLQPISANTLKKREIFENKLYIDKILNELSCLPAIWEVFDNTFVSNLIFSTLFNHILFFNLKEYNKSETRIYMPLCLFEIMKLISYYHWIEKKHTELSGSIVSTFEFSQITKKIGFRKVKRIHSNLLANISTFYKTNILLTEFMPEVKDFLKYFEMVFTEKITPSHGLHEDKYFLLDKVMQNEIAEKINSVVQKKELLKNKSSDILLVLRDRITLLSTKTNIGLQWSMIILTIIIAILTLVLVVTDNAFMNYLKKVVGKILF